MMPQVGKFDIKEKVFEALEEWAQCREIWGVEDYDVSQVEVCKASL
jgi:hypothetical protein